MKRKKIKERIKNIRKVIGGREERKREGKDKHIVQCSIGSLCEKKVSFEKLNELFRRFDKVTPVLLIKFDMTKSIKGSN